jgi:hypothetical protein
VGGRERRGGERGRWEGDDEVRGEYYVRLSFLLFLPFTLLCREVDQVELSSLISLFSSYTPSFHSSRGAGTGRALIRDLYANGEWKIFGHLSAIVPHGGTIGCVPSPILREPYLKGAEKASETRVTLTSSPPSPLSKQPRRQVLLLLLPTRRSVSRARLPPLRRRCEGAGVSRS